METPAVENSKPLMGKYGDEGNQLIFKILKRGEKLDVNDKELADLALRYDLTVPFSRVVANTETNCRNFSNAIRFNPSGVPTNRRAAGFGNFINAMLMPSVQNQCSSKQTFLRQLQKFSKHSVLAIF